MTVEKDPTNSFNWTTEQVETCEKKALCQETIIMITAGKMRKGQLKWERG